MEIKRSALLPNLCTVGNGICGFAALTRVARVQADGTGFDHPEYFTVAASLVFLGMLFDVFDGKIARMSNGTSELGAQLDSFCDLVTFGVVPAMMIVALSANQDANWQRLAWFFSLAYFLGALLRLARFNVENSPDESSHVCFKGMPTPAAAGCVASLVIFQRYIQKFDVDANYEMRFLSHYVEPQVLQQTADFIVLVLPFLALVLGLAMVLSRLEFAHVGTRLFHARHSFESFVYLIFAAVLLAMVPELVLPIAFLGYLVWTPAYAVYRFFVPRRTPPSEAR